MQTRHLVGVALAAGLVSGCATDGTAFRIAAKPHECKGGCDVPTGWYWGPPDRTEVVGGGGTSISWTIDGFGEFAPPGIVFADNKGPKSGRPVFTDCALSASHKRFSCMNSGEVGDYKYTVHYLWRLPIDPWVMNR
jgi:hypothetical protein